MSKSLNVGQSYTATVSASPAPAPGTVKAALSGTGLTITDNGDNTFHIVGSGANTNNVITFSAPGYQPAVESVIVNPLPALVVTDGAVA